MDKAQKQRTILCKIWAHVEHQIDTIAIAAEFSVTHIQPIAKNLREELEIHHHVTITHKEKAEKIRMLSMVLSKGIEYVKKQITAQDADMIPMIDWALHTTQKIGQQAQRIQDDNRYPKIITIA